LAAAPVLLLHHLVTKRVTSSIIQYVNPGLRSSEPLAQALDLRIHMEERSLPPPWSPALR